MELNMTTIRKKQIADAIKSRNFALNDFDFEPMSSSNFNLIYKRDRNYKLLTDELGNVEFWPAQNGEVYYQNRKQDGIYEVYNDMPWSDRIDYINIWLSALNENLSINDPWAEIENIENEKINIGNNGHEQLSEEEHDFVNEKLDIILEALKEFATDFERIKNDLEYLRKSGNKVSKKDWGLMVMGSVMGWGIDKAVPAESLHDVWNIILQNLGGQNLIG
jgi:hypothetical protein